MYECNLCKKKFKYDSEFKRHKNKKNPCNIPKKEYKCEICNIIFVRPSEKLRHEQTKKHLTKISNSNVNNSFNTINSYNNLIQLTLNVNSFKTTDTTSIRKALIEDIGEFEYLKIISKKYLPDTEKVKMLFNSVLKILEELHFNLDIEENHNLKILLIFPGIKKKVYEYLILEINPETKNIVCNSLSELLNLFFL